MPTDERAKKIKHVAGARQQGIVIIEDVIDPHNAAAVVRSCEAFGIQEVWYIFHKTPQFNPKRVGKATSTAANKWVDFKIFESTEECLKEAKSQGYEIVATILDDTAESLFEAKLETQKIAILLGTEREGLTQEAIALADRKVYIPMRGFVQSLNLSVTASIFLFELTRQREKIGMKQYSFSEASEQTLTESFLVR